MGRRPANALSATGVRTAKKPGRYADGNGLYLLIDPVGNKRWVQRLTIRGSRTDLGLGGYPLVSLNEAREKAFANRKLARAGGDPRADGRQAVVPTFAEAASQVIDLRRPDWRHPKTAKRWEATLRTYEGVVAYTVTTELGSDEYGETELLLCLGKVPGDMW